MVGRLLDPILTGLRRLVRGLLLETDPGPDEYILGVLSASGLVFCVFDAVREAADMVLA